MISGLPHKTKQFFFLLIKLSIVIGAFYFIYWKLTENENLKFTEFTAFLYKNELFLIKNITFLLILSIFNWFFEILKWQNLIQTIKTISFKLSMEQSLGALAASLITPNRIGDYGAKALYYTQPFRKKIVLLNLLGNTAQMAITSVFGSIGFILFVNHYDIKIDYYKMVKFAALVILFVAISIFAIKQKRFKIKGFSFKHIIAFIQHIGVQTHFKNLLFSTLRYLIFSFQFYYLLTLFGTDIAYTKAMIVISSMYFLASIIPTITILDFVVKGSVAVFLFDYLGVNALTILSTVTLMWLLNFVLPSLIGSYFIIKFKLPKPEVS